MTPPIPEPSIVETDDLAACLAIRRTVFVEEQGVPEALERDDRDEGAVHLLATSGGRPAGTARIVIEDRTGKIGRVAVLAGDRGTGLGAALVRAAVDACATRALARASLGAQVHAIGFYEKLGFIAHGPVFDDAGIPHRMMHLDLAARRVRARFEA